MTDKTDPATAEATPEPYGAATETGRRVNWLLWALPVLGLTLVNYYKLLLRGDPLLFADLRLVGEASAMSELVQPDAIPFLLEAAAARWSDAMVSDIAPSGPDLN